MQKTVYNPSKQWNLVFGSTEAPAPWQKQILHSSSVISVWGSDCVGEYFKLFGLWDLGKQHVCLMFFVKYALREWFCSIFHDKLLSQCFYFWWLSQHFSCQLHRLFAHFSVDSLILNLWSCCSVKFHCFCPLRAIEPRALFITLAYISQCSLPSLPRALPKPPVSVPEFSVAFISCYLR